jgi:hypothetical protein
MKVHFFDIKTFDKTREVVLTKKDSPISIEFHPQFKDVIILLYSGNPAKEEFGELRSINILTGQSSTLISSISYPLSMQLSPHKSEVAI